MSANTKIEWCDHSWSPWRGCTKVSPGCANCYAETLSRRSPAVLGQWGKGKPRVLAKNWKDPLKWQRAFDDFGDDARRHATVFPSLCDWLDDEVPIQWLVRFVELILHTPSLTWLLLTKRPELWRQRMNLVASTSGLNPGTCKAGEWEALFPVREMASNWVTHGIAPANVWVGTSVEDQQRADERIPALLKIPAVGRFLSLEPLLGWVDLERIVIKESDAPERGKPNVSFSAVSGWRGGANRPERTRIDWLIIGGESGPGARPCNVEWIRSLVAQGKTAAVATFVKQLGKRPVETLCTGVHRQPLACGNREPVSANPVTALAEWFLAHPKGGDPTEWPEDLRVRQFPEGLL